MKKIVLVTLITFYSMTSNSQINHVDFGTTNTLFSCDPPVYTPTNQIQCMSINPVVTTSGTSTMYYTTASGVFGQDCRNWLRLSNPGFPFIGIGSELQLRNGGNGSTTLNPARFLVKDFIAGTRFGISFDIALAGYGGTFYFRCGNGQSYGDTVYMTSRDSSSFMVTKIDAGNVLLTPLLKYSNSWSNTMWPNVPLYNFVVGANSSFPVYQKHTVAIFCNNSPVPATYNYIGLKTLNSQSFDVYLDSVLDVDNMFDDFYGLNRSINSFMFAGADAMCANSGPYLGDTLIVDNIAWTSDFTVNPLPVRLSRFNLQIVADKKEVKLSWEEMNPSDLNQYDVQMSTNGADFFTIGSVKGNDYTNAYSFVYKYVSCGVVYFRLKFDGNKYSEIRSESIPCAGPIIQGGKQMLSIDTKVGGNVALISMLGQRYGTSIVGAGRSTKQVAVPPGIYIVQFVSADGKMFTQKISIQ